MSNLKLDIYKEQSFTFEDFKKHPKQADNIFILSHLGQLKQMEALIYAKGLTNNCLVVLYTVKNLLVPNSVNKQYSNELFDFVIFFEIPFGASKVDYLQLKSITKNYSSLLRIIKSSSLYCNSFEGHYSILMSLAKSMKLNIVLVEEGTATYKLKVSDDTYIPADMSYVNQVFKDTIGSTVFFKKISELNAINNEMIVQSKVFFKRATNNENFHRKLVEKIGNRHIKSVLRPFKSFTKAYVSFPDLIKESFGIKDVDYFMIHDFMNDQALDQAKRVIASYNIRSKDILYVSQRYNLDSEHYTRAVIAILSRMVNSDQKVFIKLHPKESAKVHDSFKYMEFVSNGKFVVIEDNQFLIESVIKVSKISTVVGITSTTLVYAPLVSPDTKSISIAKSLTSILLTKTSNKIGVDTIEEHLNILRIFNNIEFQ